MSVKIAGFAVKENGKGEKFTVLKLHGDLEFVRGKESGKLYGRIKSCSIPCAFDEETAKGLIGTTLPGRIVKEECEEYTVKDLKTGDDLTLNHRYSYQEQDVASDSSQLRKVA